MRSSDALEWVGGASHAGTRFHVRISSDLHNGKWDSFLRACQGSHHLQSAVWSAVKARAGWGVRRIVLHRGGEIAGGVQVLIRRVPLVGAVGYVPRGPVLADDDPEAMALLLDVLRRLARDERIHYVLLQPAPGFPRCAALFDADDFRPSAVRAAPTATAMIDLRRTTAELLARMKPKTRYNVRLGLRKGVTVRPGTEDDLATFHRMLAATGRRNGFPIQSFAHYSAVWQGFAPFGNVKLFIAEHERAPLAGLLALAFGDTVTYWRGAWSGERGALHPNELLHWTAVQWAKAHGHRWYDLDGIEPSQVPGAQESQAQQLGRADTSFKMGFGGQYVSMPGAIDYIANPALRWAASAVFSANELAWKRKLEARMRGMRTS